MTQCRGIHPGGLEPTCETSFINNLLCGFGQITSPLRAHTASLLKQGSGSSKDKSPFPTLQSAKHRSDYPPQGNLLLATGEFRFTSDQDIFYMIVDSTQEVSPLS